MTSTALGVKVFTRTDKLGDLLDSVDPAVIDVVYVADDGEITPEKEELYGRSYEFDLEVLDLKYDAGLGYGRKRIVDQLTEDYLLIVDSDHVLPYNVDRLRRILEEEPALGGVSGAFIQNNQIRGPAHNLYEEGNLLVRDIRGETEVREIANVPVAEFDFIPNAAMFRRACVEEYTWDENYVIGSEHEDFYIGHKRRTDWRFGICPAVLFHHYPGGSSGYLSNRENAEKLRRSREYFLDKWGFEQIFFVRSCWFNSYQPNRSPIKTCGRVVKRAATLSPPPIQRTAASGIHWCEKTFF